MDLAPPQLPLLLAPCEVIGFGPQGPAVLGSFSGAISCDVTGLGGGLSGHAARPPGSQDCWAVACGAPPGPGVPIARGGEAASQAKPVPFLYFMTP